MLVEDEHPVVPSAWHPDVGLLVEHGQDILVFDPERPEDELQEVVATPAYEWSPDVPPDGRWLAYTSQRSGRYEVVVRALEGGQSWTVSNDGGEEPRWSGDGTALYYRNGHRFHRASVAPGNAEGGAPEIGTPTVVAEGPYLNVGGYSHDVDPTNDRLILLRKEGATERIRRLDVVLGWDPGAR